MAGAGASPRAEPIRSAAIVVERRAPPRGHARPCVVLLMAALERSAAPRWLVVPRSRRSLGSGDHHEPVWGFSGSAQGRTLQPHPASPWMRVADAIRFAGRRARGIARRTTVADTTSPASDALRGRSAIPPRRDLAPRPCSETLLRDRRSDADGALRAVVRVAAPAPPARPPPVDGAGPSRRRGRREGPARRACANARRRAGTPRKQPLS